MGICRVYPLWIWFVFDRDGGNSVKSYWGPWRVPWGAPEQFLQCDIAYDLAIAGVAMGKSSKSAENV